MVQQQHLKPHLILAIYVKCEGLYSLREGKQPDIKFFTEYGFYSTPQPITHIELTRQKFLELADQEIRADMQRSGEKMVQMLRDYATSVPPTNMKDGVIRKDELAVYSGLAIKTDTIIFGGVNGVTLVSDIPVFCYVYDQITPNQSFEMLVNKTRLLISDLISAN
jgi:hypothetical protein